MSIDGRIAHMARQRKPVGCDDAAPCGKCRRCDLVRALVQLDVPRDTRPLWQRTLDADIKEEAGQ